MRRTVCIMGLAVLVIAMCTDQAATAAQVTLKAVSNDPDPVALGQPLSHWLKVIRSRDPEEIELAYDAIVQLGPLAWRAVPELTHIVAEPFTPIRLGTDDRREILSKLLDIHRRAGAVDSLGAIGTAASSAARPVMDWALTSRVLPSDVRTPNDAFYIELVGMDILERMRGAASAARFGVLASGVVQELLESRDPEKIKFAVAILSDGSVPIATDLMTSESCRDRMLGLTILADMWPVVAMDHLNSLKDILACRAGDPNEGTAVGSAAVPSTKIRSR